MILRLIIVLGLALAISACGVKSDLLMPDGKPTPKDQQDPAKPPRTLGK